MSTPCMAIIDDDLAFASLASDYASKKGFATKSIHSASEARLWLADNDPDLTLLDISLPDGDGFDIIESVPRDHSGGIVFVTGSTSAEHARRAVASPADAYLCKPLPPARLDELLEDAKHRHRLHADLTTPGRFGLVGESPALRTVLRDIATVASYDTSVLILGETGTGKEVVARALHQLSRRRGRFVAINCGAVPAELLGSQLFGHERGSFTGATGRHAGYFEQADGGTLFLDEIGDMPAELQVYLLRVLEAGAVTRLGGSEEIPVNTRVIAATHRCLDGGEGNGLRADLYYRLARFPLHLPALRERGGDIELLAQHFLSLLNRHHGTHKPLDPRCIDGLRAYDWPGNVRELAGVVERSYLRSGDEPVFIRPPSTPGGRHVAQDDMTVLFRVGMSWRHIQEEMLNKTLAFHGGDKTAAARSLGVSVRTIHNHLSRS